MSSPLLLLVSFHVHIHNICERLEGRSKWICEDAMDQLDLTFVVLFESSPKPF